MGLEFNDVKKGFADHLKEIGAIKKWVNPNSSYFNIFDYSDELQNYLKQNYNDDDIFNLSKMLNDVQDMKVNSRGQLIKNNNSSSSDNKENNFVDGALHELSSNKSIRKAMDTNNNYKVDKYELADYFNSISNFDSDSDNISIKDINESVSRVKNNTLNIGISQRPEKVQNNSSKSNTRSASTKNNTSSTSKQVSSNSSTNAKATKVESKNLNSTQNTAKTIEYKGTITKELAQKIDNKLGQGFTQKLIEISQKIKCNPEDLLGIMISESGLKSSAINSRGGATGLIQFLPQTAKDLGTTTAHLSSLTPVEQLDWVLKFYEMVKPWAFSNDTQLSAGELYALTFLPGYANKEVLCTKNDNNNYYKNNSGLDKNKDGKITKTELGNRVKQKFQEIEDFL